ncbi:MAG: hypothetical protein KDD70_04610, partial [Bdellovibrionales bacterium]|nr:hypothetical protein [Bdellovibrionales bacterium]
MRFRFSRYFFALFGIAFTTGLASHSLYAQSNIQNIYVSPSGQGARTGNEQNAFSFEQALNHMRANSERFVSYHLLPGNYGDRDIALAGSQSGGNRAWKTFVGDNASFGKLQLLRAPGSPIGTKGLLGFHRVNIREAIVELNQ